jgi:hypothetical protein
VEQAPLAENRKTETDFKVGTKVGKWPVLA